MRRAESRPGRDYSQIPRNSRPQALTHATGEKLAQGELLQITRAESLGDGPNVGRTALKGQPDAMRGHRAELLSEQRVEKRRERGKEERDRERKRKEEKEEEKERMGPPQLS